MQVAPASWQAERWRKSKRFVKPPTGILIEYVHLLQVERGKSATWIASATQASTDRQAAVVMNNVLEARSSTDAYILNHAKVWPKEDPRKEELAILRVSADHFRHPILTAGLEADAKAFLGVLSGYTKLIELLCAAIDKQLQVGWHEAVLRSLIRYDEAMAHQRGLLCSFLALPDRLFSALPPSATTELEQTSRAQTQISGIIESMLNADKLEPRCKRLVSHTISLSRRLELLQAQLCNADMTLGLLRETMTIEGCWTLFTQHLEDNRIAEVALAAHIGKSGRLRLPRLFHSVRGNTNLDLKMTKRTQSAEEHSSSSIGVVSDAASRRWGLLPHAGKLFCSA